MKKNEKIYIAGHNGMVGSAITRALQKEGYKNLLTVSHEELNLEDQQAVASFFKKNQPDYVILAAAKVGGIKANMEHKAEFLYRNLTIETNVIHQSFLNKVKKVCFLGSNCVYPRNSPQPITENSLLTGPFEPTNEGYAIAKLAGLKMIEYYHNEYGLNAISLMPSNLYGPNDNFDPNDSHVLSALVKRFVDACEDELDQVVNWGTGKAIREFMHVDDLARAVVFLMENYDSPDIINIGTGKGISILELTTLIAKTSGYKGKILWDNSKPDGMPIKMLDVTKLIKLGFKSTISLEDGIKSHVAYYQKTKKRFVPLIRDTFSHEPQTRAALAEFVLKAPKLSMGDQCRQFEMEFARFQERQDAILFNSGSSANLALLQALLNLGRLKQSDKIGFSALTWATTVMPIIQLGMKPIPVDCEVKTLNSMSKNLLDSLKTTSLKAFFITNVLGFTADLEKVRQICAKRGIILLEDNCESLGTELLAGKAGNFGLASSVSFYVAHHLSTIEGGITATDDPELAEMLRVVRAHGWDRNLTPDQQNVWRQKHKITSDFQAKYSFYDLGYNLRPTEITGFIGLSQLPLLKENIKIRQANFLQLEKSVRNNHDLIMLDHSHIKFLSSYAFPVICRSGKLREKYLARFMEAGVEVRPVITGNISQQPFFKKYVKKNYSLPGADFIHDCGFYCGNYPELKEKELEVLARCLAP